MTKSYRVTGRSQASFIFRLGDEISTDYVRDGITGRVTLGTRYLECGYDIPVPGDLMMAIEVESAENAEEAFTWVTVGHELASLISLATNAALAHPEGELVIETTPGKSEREHLQRFVPGDKGTFSSRTVPMDATVAFMSAVAVSPERNRLLRAVTQYNEALFRWKMGNELLSLSHLFMGIEAIKKACLRCYMQTHDINKTELAELWGFDPKRSQSLDHFLDSEARVRLAFHGDALHHKIARAVSDSFEHGLKNGGELFKQAREALVPTAKHLRHSILEVANIDEQHFQTLTGSAFSRPRGLGGLEQYFRSVLVGEEVQGSDGWPHPCWDWKHSIKAVKFDAENGVYSFTPDHNMTARISPSHVFKPGNLEVWDGGVYMPSSAGDILMDSALEPELPLALAGVKKLEGK